MPDANLDRLLELRKQFREDHPEVAWPDADAVAKMKERFEKEVEREETRIKITEIEQQAAQKPKMIKRLLAEKYNLGAK
jgi:hypothetical protein